MEEKKLVYNHKKAGKPSDVEELVDVIINRKLASLIVRTFLNTKITPNQVTLMSLLTGIISGISYYLGCSPIISAIFLFMAIVFDCADGQLARSRGKGSLSGRIIDGMCDYLVTIAVFFFVLIKVIDDKTIDNFVLLSALAGLSVVIQCYSYDYFKNKYIKYTKKDYRESEGNLEEIKQNLHKAKESRNKTDILVFTLYYYIYIRLFVFAQWFVKKINKGKEIASKNTIKEEFVFNEKNAEIFTKTHSLSINLWSYNGYSSHIYILIISFILNVFISNAFLFGYLFIITIMNILLLVTFIFELIADKKYNKYTTQ